MRNNSTAGACSSPGGTPPYDLKPALDRLADMVRSHLDMDRIYRLLQL